MRYQILIGVLVILTIMTGCTQKTAGPDEDMQFDFVSTNDVKAVNPMNSGTEGVEAAERNEAEIDPGDFTSVVDNKYFTLTPGKKLVYEGKTEDGTERIEVYVTDERRTVMGVETVVVWDRVWLNDELIEDTKDWYAQDNEGNVWYFGEDTAELIDGKIINHDGAWEGGVDDAIPGIIMPAEPVLGKTYQTEYYEGVAEDRIDILALDETVTVPFETLSGCLKTLDYTPLEPGIEEHKYHCPDVAFTVLEVALEDGERVELLSLEYDALPSPSTVEVEPEDLTTEITEEKAKEIALDAVPGKVTDIEIERKSGKVVFVVQVDPDKGPETDVLIDIDTGEILGIET